MKKKFYRVAFVADLVEKSLKKAQVEGHDIVVARAGSEYFAFAHRCTHRGGPLAMGELRDYSITCPWHGGIFDIRTGELSHPPPVEHIMSYPLRIVDGAIEVEVPEKEV